MASERPHIRPTHQESIPRTHALGCFNVVCFSSIVLRICPMMVSRLPNMISGPPKTQLTSPDLTTMRPNTPQDGPRGTTNSSDIAEDSPNEASRGHDIAKMFQDGKTTPTYFSRERAPPGAAQHPPPSDYSSSSSSSSFSSFPPLSRT